MLFQSDSRLTHLTAVEASAFTPANSWVALDESKLYNPGVLALLYG